MWLWNSGLVPIPTLPAMEGRRQGGRKEREREEKGAGRSKGRKMQKEEGESEERRLVESKAPELLFPFPESHLGVL